MYHVKDFVGSRKPGKRILFLLLVVILGSFMCQVLIFNINFYWNRRDVVNVIVFKLPRSGSSWFAELMNSPSTVFISKEIIQRTDLGVHSQLAKERHLNNALQFPTGKLARSFSGRFLDDYIFHRSLKIFNRQKVIGFSVNPEHCFDIDWRRVLNGVPNVKIIVYSRSNVVKATTSGIRGSITSIMCGTANIKEGQKCEIPDHVDIASDQFLCEVSKRSDRQEHFNQTIYNHPVLSKLPIHTVYYEDLQSNLGETLQKLGSFLIGDQSLFISSDTQSYLNNSMCSYLQPTIDQPPCFVPKHAINQQKGWKKRTSDNLQMVLRQFKVINDTLTNAGQKCHCWLHQLNDQKQETFSHKGSSHCTEDKQNCSKQGKSWCDK